MLPIKTLFIIILFKTCLSQDLEEIFQIINKEAGNFNSLAADIAWESSIDPGNPELPSKSAAYQRKRILWDNKTCSKLGSLYVRQLLNETQKRQSYLLCRGPKFTFDEARFTSDLYAELQSIYADAEICIPYEGYLTIENLTNVETAILNYLSNVKQFLNMEEEDYVLFAAKIAASSDNKEKNRFCLIGENDFEKLMRFSRNEIVLRWLWLVWREKVGPPMKEPFKRLANVENQAVRRNGYPNIGASWRDEVEMPRLRQQCRHLYNDVQYLYSLLHAVVRFYLRRHYGPIVPKTGPIPGHLLGNLWSQNWESLANMMVSANINLDRTIKERNWTVEHMVKRAEDFYQSLGLPAMTDKFWRESVFTRDKGSKTRCHGTAADMFKDGDYRLLYCSGTTMEDLYVLHHELGHIQYYMAYKHQPTLFRQANTVLHETIGDTIMYGVLTPQHLNRLGLINDSLLYTLNKPEDITNENHEIHAVENTKPGRPKTNVDINDIVDERSSNIDVDDEKSNNIDEGFNVDQEFEELFTPEEMTTEMLILLKQALNKIPQIPFSLVIDEYRWKYFEGSLQRGMENKEFWDLVEELQGVSPVGKRGEEYFDVGAKFHVPDNTPYVRYFLSSFLQHQLFERLCKAAVFGQRNTKHSLPDTITLNRCDIYGSKAVGKILKDLMARGHSQHWSEILEATIKETDITASSLIKYYKPLSDVLEKFIQKHKIHIGW